MAINGVTTALNRPYMSFAIRKICIDGQTMYTFSRSHENLLSPTNEVQFIDCKQLSTDRVWVLWSVQSIRIDALYIPYFNMKIFLVPLMRCNFWTGLYLRFAICTIGMDHNVVYMDHYSAGILDNPLCLQYLLMLLGNEMGHLKVYLSDNYGI